MKKTRGRKSRVRVPLNATNSDPTSWKCGVVRGPHRCPKIPALAKHETQFKSAQYMNQITKADELHNSPF
jgi:hypothetical protein